MIERILITLALFLLGMIAYILLRNWQMYRAGQVTATSGRSGVIYFRSDYCAPCITQGRFLQELQEKFGERIEVEKINADLEKDTAARYGVFTLPTTLIVDKTGKVRYANYGLADIHKLSHQLMAL